MLEAKMKPRFYITAILLASFILLGNVNIAQAPWSSLNSGYAITTNYFQMEVPPGTPVTAKAGFIVKNPSPLDPNVTWIQFIWHFPNDTIARNESVYPPFSPDAFTNKSGTYTVYYLTDTYTPTVYGDWGVQAVFRGPGGRIMGLDTTDPAFSIKATSFNVVPEVPFGTIAVLVAMFGALGVFAIKKKHLLPLGPPT